MELQSALRHGDFDRAEYLIGQGVGINRPDDNGLSPLMVAAGLAQQKMVALLCGAGADIFALDPRMGTTALHKAAQSGNVDVIAVLLDQGAFIDQQSPTLGHTALMDAVLHKREDGVRALLARGAKPNLRNHWDQTALDLAETDGLETIAHMIRTEVASNEASVQNFEFGAAAKAGDYEKVARLIASGVDLDRRMPITGTPDDDYTALGIAAREGHAAIVSLLIEKGADMRSAVGLMKGTPFHEAAYFGHADVIDILGSIASVSRRPNIDAQGPYNGLTALHDAVWHGHADAVKSLIAAGASPDIRSHAGLTPKELALLYGYIDIASVLAEKEAGD